MNWASSIVLLLNLLDSVTGENSLALKGLPCSINCVLSTAKSIINITNLVQGSLTKIHQYLSRDWDLFSKQFRLRNKSLKKKCPAEGHSPSMALVAGQKDRELKLTH